jgi:CHAT domain-containing protein/Tol biopolymer transport system component
MCWPSIGRSRAKRQIGRAVWLASFASNELAGQLSPDGRLLVFAGDRRGDLDIWTKDLTSGALRRLTKHPAVDTQPAFSADGEAVVFVSMRHDAKGDLMLWRKGAIERLTDAKLAESYPTFAPDGSIYYAAGDTQKTRIHRLDPSSKKHAPVSRWGATHPAVSPDGRWLAFTWLDAERRARIVLERLSDKKTWIVTTGAYPAGFPTFSPDSKVLAFARFYRGQPNKPRVLSDRASIWSIALTNITRRADAAERVQYASQLTSDGASALLLRWHKSGIVFSSRRQGNLDVGLLHSAGIVPRLNKAIALLKLARSQRDPQLRLTVLRACWQRRLAAASRNPRSHATQAANRAMFLASEQLLSLDEFSKARVLLEKLSTSKDATIMAQLARIDLVVLRAERARRRHLQGAQRAAKGAALQLAKLQMPRSEDRVSAYRLLKLGDMQRYSGQTKAAIETYRRLLSRYSAQKKSAALARLQLGELYNSARDIGLLTSYYLAIFAQYPGQTDVLEIASRRVLRLLSAMPPRQQLIRLRKLVTAHRDKPVFGVAALQRIARLHEKAGRLGAAVRAYSEAVNVARQSKLEARIAVGVSFELGELSLRYAAELRRIGRGSLALSHFTSALLAYERLMRRHERASDVFGRAKRGYLKLSLEQATALRRRGDLAGAERRYKTLLKFDDNVIQAHRELLRLQVKKRREELAKRYRSRLARDDGDFVALYALAYLDTLASPLKKSDLARAQKRLLRAVSLRPQSPFAHLTLGWVYEMRERYFGETGRGWLEEAILHYERARSLNDPRFDPQTEADALTNLTNVYVSFGGEWKQGNRLCQKRSKLDVPPRSAAQQAYQLATCSRAASAIGDHVRAIRGFEKALQLAEKLGFRRFLAELRARLALEEHLRGDYGKSNRLFEAAFKEVAVRGSKTSLAGIVRTMAYNDILLGDTPRAIKRLERAKKLLARHGGPAIDSFLPESAAADPSSAPFGFDTRAERAVQLALREIVRENAQHFRRALEVAQKRLSVLQEAAGKKKLEKKRELILVRNRLALSALALGKQKLFREQLVAAHKGLAQLEALAKKGEGAFDASARTVEIGLLCNMAAPFVESVRRDQAVDLSLARRLTGQLLAIEGARRRARVAKEGATVLPHRARFRLWSTLAALLQVSAQGRDRADMAAKKAKAARKKVQKRKKPASAANSAIDASLAALDKTFALAEAITYLQRLVAELRPDKPLPASSVTEAMVKKWNTGVYASLWRPLSERQRMRFYVRAVLELGSLSTRYASRAQLASHPTTAMLERAAQLSLQHDLGALRFALSSELAYRRADSRAMQLAVAAFLARSALRMPIEYATDGANVRDRIFDRAVALAFEKKDWAWAVALAEARERRQFADQLAILTPKARGETDKLLKALLVTAAAYRSLLASEWPKRVAQGPAQRRQRVASGKKSSAPGAWRRFTAQQATLERALSKAQMRLARHAPEVARLFVVEPFSLAALRSKMEADDAVVTTVSDSRRYRLVAIRKKGLVAKDISRIVFDLRRANAGSKARAEAVFRLRAELEKLVSGCKRLYLDLGRIAANIELSQTVPTVRLATLWELLDSRAQRTADLPRAIGVGNSPVRSTAVRIKTLAWSKKPSRYALERALDHAGVALLAAKTTFEGGAATNIKIDIPNREAATPTRWWLMRALGQPLWAAGLVLTDVRFTAGRERRQRVALHRLLHAMGVSAVIYAPAKTNTARWRRFFSRRAKQGLWTAAEKEGFSLWGDSGFSKKDRAAMPKTLRKLVFGGARAFNRRPRDLPAAIQLLSRAVKMMAYLGKPRFLSGGLLYLANAYTLRGDVERGLFRMQQLVALKQSAVEKAPAKRRKRAMASLALAMTRLAWAYMRSKQLDRALSTNREAITLYRRLARKSELRNSFAQRSTILEKKGRHRAALEFAMKAETTARALIGRKKSVGRRLVASKASLRVARLLRQRFSRYVAAFKKAKKTLAGLQAVDRIALRESEQTIGVLEGALKRAKGKAARSAAKRRLRAALRARANRRALVDTIFDLQLELTRIQSARGIFGEAVRQAQQALEQARTAGKKKLGRGWLELVNNLYYMGAYRRALGLIEVQLRRRDLPALRRVQFMNVNGTTLSRIGQGKEAIEVLKRALASAKQLGKPAEVASTYNNLGDALRARGQYERAREAFAQALEIDRKRGDQLGISFDLANLGLTYLSLRVDGRGRRLLEQAVALAKRIGAPLNQLKALSGLSQLALSRGEEQAALARASEGLSVARRLGLRNWMWRFSLLAGRALRKQKKLGAAQRHFERGIAIIETQPPRQRQQGAGRPSRAAVRQLALRPAEVYEELLDILVDKKATQQAFELAQRYRGRWLVDAVSRDVSQLAWKEVAELNRDIVRVHASLEDGRASVLRATITKRSMVEMARRVSAQSAKLQALHSKLRGVSSGLATLVGLDRVSWPAIRKAVRQRKGVVFLHYICTARQIVVWYVDAKKSGMIALPVKRAALARQLAALRHRLRYFGPTGVLARRLHRELLDPVLARITPRAKSAENRTLLIVAPGVLQMLPFSALLDKDKPLVARFPLVRLPDAGMLLLAKKNAAATGGDTNGPLWRSFSWPSARAASAALPFSAREAGALARAFGDATVQRFAGESATKAALLTALSDAKRIHVATHGVQNVERPLLGGIALRDGVATFKSLIAGPIKARQIVLSACNLQAPLPANADIIAMPARLFLLAGAEQVVSTYWRVSDLGAALVMKHYFRALASGQSSARALQTARRRVRALHPHPGFWAAFRLDGLDR